MKEHLAEIMEQLENRNFAQALNLGRELGEDRDTLANTMLTALECQADLGQPELPSHYLPTQIRNKTITTKQLEHLYKHLKAQGVSAMNVALALDLIERESK